MLHTFRFFCLLCGCPGGPLLSHLRWMTHPKLGVQEIMGRAVGPIMDCAEGVGVILQRCLVHGLHKGTAAGAVGINEPWRPRLAFARVQ